MHMMGDLTGRALLLFPQTLGAHPVRLPVAARARAPPRSSGRWSSPALKEAGNILASAYLNALSDFMGMMLVPSVPSLVIDLSGAVLTSAHLNFGHDRDYAFCVETSFRLEGATEPLARAFPAAARHCVPAVHLRRHPTALIDAGPGALGARSHGAALLCPSDRPIRRRGA